MQPHHSLKIYAYFLEVRVLHEFDSGLCVVVCNLKAEAALGVRRGQPDQRLQGSRSHRLRLHKQVYVQPMLHLLDTSRQFNN